MSQVISVKRIREKIAQKPVTSDFSPKEATIIREAKRKTALQFLAEIKQTRKGSITQTERDLLQQMAALGLLDEVINVILLLTFNKVDSANINEKYAMRWLMTTPIKISVVPRRQFYVFVNVAKKQKRKSRRLRLPQQKPMCLNGAILSIRMKPAKKLV